MLLLSMLVASMLLVSCGKSGENGSGSEETEAKLVGSLSEIMDSVYENADLSQDFRDAMADFDSGEIPAESAEYMIGTADVEYEEGFYSLPMINLSVYPVKAAGRRRYGSRQTDHRRPCRSQKMDLCGSGKCCGGKCRRRYPVRNGRFPDNQCDECGISGIGRMIRSVPDLKAMMPAICFSLEFYCAKT